MINEQLQKKIDRALKGATWEEAKECGVYILSKYVGFKTYRDEDFDFIGLMKEIAVGGDEWVHNEGGSFVVAMARAAEKSKSKE